MPAEPAQPTQALRDQFATAIDESDFDTIAQLLLSDPLLVNIDLRVAEHRNHFTNGYPLFRTCQKNDERLSGLLLEHGAHPDAPGN